MALVSDKIIATGNVSDSPLAIDINRLLGIPIDISDRMALKSFANSEFCPRFITNDEDEDNLEKIGKGLKARTVVIVSTTSAHYDRNSLAMRNFVLARAAKDNGAERVILVEPDLFYSAQDRGPFVDEGRDIKDVKKFDGQPFTAKLYAQLLKSSGVDTVITVHNHSILVQEEFRKIFEGDFHNLIPADVYADYIKRSDMVQVGKDGNNLVLVAPDKGAKPFMEEVFKALDLPNCKRVWLQKERTGERHVSMQIAPESEISIEDIEGKDVIVLDDMVRTGNTIVQCCEMLREGHARKVCFGVTHFYTSAEARENLNTPFVDEIMTTNTIPTILNRDQQGRLRRKLVVLKLGKWITRYILELLEMDDELYEKNFYSIDMSSQNLRWPPPSL